MLFPIIASIIFGCLISLSTEVDQYKCASELEMDTCYLRETSGSDSIIYMGACAKGQSCELVNDIGKCVTPEKLLDIDDSRVSPLECRSGMCTNGKCSVYTIGAAYTFDDQCPKNSYCKTIGSDKKCTQFVGLDEACTQTEDCQIGMACHIIGANTSGVCKVKFGFDIGTETNDGALCNTAISQEKGSQRFCVRFVENNSTCVEKPLDTLQDGYHCKITYEGIGVEGWKFCYLNYTGEPVCRIKQNEYIDNYVSQYKEAYKTLSESDKNNRDIDRKTLNIDSLADAFDDFRNYLEFRPEKLCSSKSNSNDNGNNNGNSDNTNNENNNNSNLQGSDSDSSLFITMSFSVLISFFVL